MHGRVHLCSGHYSIARFPRFVTQFCARDKKYGNTNEKNKQAQYAYYSAGNSKIKYKHDGTSTAAGWWLRSPYASYSYYFVLVNAGGTVYPTTAYCSLGFAPGFCV